MKMMAIMGQKKMRHSQQVSILSMASMRSYSSIIVVVLLLTIITSFISFMAHAQTDLSADATSAGYGLSSTTASSATSAGTYVYFIDSSNQVLQRINVSPFNPGGTQAITKTLAPALQGISVGGPYGAAWGASTQTANGGFVPYFENFITGQWFPTSGGITQVSIGGPQGYIWGINSNGASYFRTLANPFSPGTGWQPVTVFSIFLSQVEIGGPFGDVFALGTK